VLFFPFAFNQIGKTLTFGFLALMALGQAIFTYLYVPETKNKALEEVEAFWTGVAKEESPVAQFGPIQEDS
jgi:hypothetical protein